jgi:hypothetical protein
MTNNFPPYKYERPTLSKKSFSLHRASVNISLKKSSKCSEIQLSTVKMVNKQPIVFIHEDIIDESSMDSDATVELATTNNNIQN